MIHTINTKALELYHRIADKTRSEAGQTTSEYVAVTAVAVAIAIGILYVVLSTAINDAVTSIATALTDFVDNPGGVAP